MYLFHFYSPKYLLCRLYLLSVSIPSPLSHVHCLSIYLPISVSVSANVYMRLVEITVYLSMCLSRTLCHSLASLTLTLLHSVRSDPECLLIFIPTDSYCDAQTSSLLVTVLPVIFSYLFKFCFHLYRRLFPVYC